MFSESSSPRPQGAGLLPQRLRALLFFPSLTMNLLLTVVLGLWPWILTFTLHTQQRRKMFHFRLQRGCRQERG